MGQSKEKQKAYQALLSELEQEAKQGATEAAAGAAGKNGAGSGREDALKTLHCEEEVEIFNDRSKSNDDLADEVAALEEELAEVDAQLAAEKNRRKQLQGQQRDLDHIRRRAWLEVQSMQLQLDALEDLCDQLDALEDLCDQLGAPEDLCELRGRNVEGGAWPRLRCVSQAERPATPSAKIRCTL